MSPVKHATGDLVATKAQALMKYPQDEKLFCCCRKRFNVVFVCVSVSVRLCT